MNLIKKVLFIDHRPTSDWGLDLLWAGLINNLGYQNVIDYPAHDKHRKRPVLVGDPEKDWGSERGSLGFTFWGEYCKKYTREEIINFIRNNEISCIFIDERVESYQYYLHFQVAKFLKIPVVVVAGHDRFWNYSPQQVKTNYYNDTLLLMYIDNWRNEYKEISYVRNYNWAVNFDHLWDVTKRQEYLNDKIYDISFMGYNSHCDRQYYINHILSRWGHLNNHIVLETRSNTFDSFVNKSEYFKTIAQSKICLNLRGAAENGKTMRFWEIPYVGSFMLSQPLEHQIDPFIHGQHCLYFSSIEELDRNISWMLRENKIREEIALNGKNHALQNHVTFRVKRMLYEIENQLKLRNNENGQ